MINSTAFDYVNVLTKAADASYQREAILANNRLIPLLNHIRMIYLYSMSFRSNRQ